MLARVCAVEEEVLTRALPSFRHQEEVFTGREAVDEPQALWRVVARW